MSVGFMSVWIVFLLLFVFRSICICVYSSLCRSQWISSSPVHAYIGLINKKKETDCDRNLNFYKFEMKSVNKNWIEHWMTKFQIKKNKKTSHEVFECLRLFIFLVLRFVRMISHFDMWHKELSQVNSFYSKLIIILCMLMDFIITP